MKILIFLLFPCISFAQLHSKASKDLEDSIAKYHKLWIQTLDSFKYYQNQTHLTKDPQKVQSLHDKAGNVMDKGFEYFDIYMNYKDKLKEKIATTI